MYAPSGLNAKYSEIVYAKIPQRISGVFCLCSEIEYGDFRGRQKKFSKLIFHRNDKCSEIGQRKIVRNSKPENAARHFCR